jgi:hypothetical protein
METLEAAKEAAGVIVKKKIRRGYSVLRTNKRTMAQY